ncbi:carboxylesterase/lipase family protein [Modestobacter marinus]|uniref:carboxylesterase/lipase family protein n=1 Tax=Modestobacter marinus TaxID=477641 RepID=UPI001C9899FA|nr:carboxylesterase family protein [Modestobacter marinus]
MSEPTTSPVVSTRAGGVRGRWEGGLAVFRGIPFAAPPVGRRRFQEPEPAEPWDGVREADVYGPPPPQSFLGPPPSTPAVSGPVRHDPTDWLTLNVWTPDPGSAGLPVMVWTPGGGYRFGTSSDPAYDGGALARDGVVVVTANHRVGVEGYAELGGAPANRALLDQIAALRWAQEEIVAFGGDPARVTVFGQSAGAGAIAALMVMPTAAGLFARAVAQSVPGTFFTPALAADISAELTAPLGLEPRAAALADVAPERLLDALAQLDRRMPAMDRWGLVAGGLTPFSPVVDGEVLPTDPWSGLSAGAGRDVRLLVGHNRDEWRLFLALGGLLGAVTEEMADATMELLGPGPDAAARMRAAYPAANAEELFVLAHSDREFRMPSLQLAAVHTAGGGRSHLYELTWPAPGSGGVLGACHFLDVPLVFGVLDRGQATQLLGAPPAAEAGEVSALMQTAWTAFARDGQPGWAAYDEQQRITRVFDHGNSDGVRAYPEEASRRLWADTTPAVLDVRR